MNLGALRPAEGTHKEVVSEIATEFDVGEEPVTAEIASVSDWLPRLDEFRDIGTWRLVQNWLKSGSGQATSQLGLKEGY